MKWIIITSLLLQVMCLSAQNSGTVYYNEIRKLHINIQGNASPPPNLPTENTNHTVLHFTADASLYMNDESKQNDGMNADEENGEGDRIVIRMGAPDNRVYCDFTNKTVVRQEDFMQRKFLVESELKADGWRLTGKQKIILNYPCVEAVKEDSTQKVVVYFTPSITVSTGPQEFIGLPGLVMEANIDDGDQIIIATEIKLEVNAEKIQKPKDGKKVTEEEFNAIVDEKMKEMGIERGGGNVIIKIEED